MHIRDRQTGSGGNNILFSKIRDKRLDDRSVLALIVPTTSNLFLGLGFSSKASLKEVGLLILICIQQPRRIL